jgi:hypothetical protein
VDAVQGGGPDAAVVVVVVVVEVVGAAVLVLVVVVVVVGLLAAGVPDPAVVDEAEPLPELPQAVRSRTRGRTSALFMFRGSSIL